MTDPLVHWEVLVSAGRPGVAPARIVACTRRPTDGIPASEESSLYRQDVTCAACINANGKPATRKHALGSGVSIE